ncbi:tetratricopeptide repeat protein [Tianweitania sediminis]|uniref:Sel1 repeat family protein n=1 Tax=Tianweitania sediminis TaxID=1502156 RepID=A0A8J7UID2_9HYPH|nr:tetratricopeptide repeat protein [Tianweitania sediminis]MBP0437534.1 sel1 repeat family protein [Tianweitania sediminis]
MTIGSLEAAAESRPPAITWEWFNAATIHLKNQGAGNRSQTLAAHYYRLAAERGNAAAAYKLGEMWEEGRGLQQDYGQALRWYRLAAEQGDRYALFKLGLFSQKGWGGGKDAKKAARFYLAAAQAGNLWGLHMLAFMLADGDGLDPDGGRAILYFEQSLPFTGDHWAKWKLAVLLGDRDPGRADRLMQEAAAAGNPEALKAKAAQPRN